MQYRLISLLPLQLARLLRLVHSIDAVQLQVTTAPQWVLLANGRGFTRILRDEPLNSPGLLRPASGSLPRPMHFPSRTVAVTYAQSLGLVPRNSRWTISKREA